MRPTVMAAMKVRSMMSFIVIIYHINSLLSRGFSKKVIHRL